MPTLILTKHHGLGNDFLVLLDLDDRHGGDAHAMAPPLCDRKRGIGADGLIRVSPGRHGADFTMDLHNSDGSPAEMSGNGMRCLAQAVVDGGLHGGFEMTVATAAGVRQLAVFPEKCRGLRQVTVDMGKATIVEVEPELARVEIGNPHLVLRDTGQDLEALGRQNPDVNVELIAANSGAIAIRVHERGAGITEACGTGSCAAAVVAREWGMAGDEVIVRNPGGDVTVELKPDTVLLTGPVQFVARVEALWP